jgi:hypothetical protein
MPVARIRTRLRLRDLIGDLRAAFDAGRITATAAEKAAGLADRQQYELAATLAERGAVTARDVRELTSARAQHAAAQLPTGPFDPVEPAWPATVGGHITAALAATPDDAPEPLRAALEAAQAALPR